ncbi:antitoxin VapB family protein [Halomicrobium sp. IBSBa]|mgnify:CR=1 FL=1|uniref:antitoxin VapB family protein n=1 Tax=Halomicrobium sp. IBSBa TaxID=2778916 RepID=UPI001AC00899|nr:antitoxin VapB family protein [Halomicrobium sp. IBSBa]MBO4247668.1 antitoxin VapB family protein [Halomicrobium sp. IBSBa]
MGGTTIRLSEEAKERLALLKREDESFEDVIMRLTEDDKWAGFGALSDSPSDTRDGMKRLRSQMRDGIDDDIGEDS